MTVACSGNNVPHDEYLKIESHIGGTDESPAVVVSVTNPEARDRGLLHEIVVVDPQGNPAGTSESTSAYLVKTTEVDVETEIPFSSPTQDGYYVVLVRSASTDFADASGAQDERLLVRVDDGRLTVVTRDEYEANSNEAEARKLSDSQLEIPQ